MTISRQYFRFVLLIAVSLAIWGHALITTLALALGNGKYTHILLILPISAAVFFTQRNQAKGSGGPELAGVGLLVAAVAITIWNKWVYSAAHADSALSLSMLALVIWWFGAVIFSFGTRSFRSALFPLLFLLWMVPWPPFVLNRIVIALQQGSALFTRYLFTLASVPVSQNGLVLSIPGVDLEIAQECSSIRSSLMLMVATIVLAHLFLTSPWRKLAVVMAAVPLSVAKNAVRIFTLSMLATNVDPGFLTGKLHQQGGFVFFLLALGAICLMIWILRRSETGKGSKLGLRTAGNSVSGQ